MRLTAAGAVTVTIDTTSGWPCIVGVSRGGSTNWASESNLAWGGAMSYGQAGAVYEAFDSSYDLIGRSVTFTK